MCSICKLDYKVPAQLSRKTGLQFDFDLTNWTTTKLHIRTLKFWFLFLVFFSFVFLFSSHNYE